MFVAELSSQVLEVGGERMLLSTLVDITARKRAETSLKESEERLQVVIENLTEGLVISDLDGRLLHWNRAGLAMHGFHDLSEGRRLLPEFAAIFELQVPDGKVLPLSEWPLPRIIRGESLRDLELQIRRLDLPWERTFSYGGALVREASGRQIAFLTITDITERRRGEQALRARDVAEAANRMKSEFLATMSHELRTPLNGNLGFTELLVDGRPGPLNPKQRQYLTEVLGSGRHLLRLINDVLDLSKVEAGRMEVFPEPVTLGAEIGEACAGLLPLVEQKHLVLRREIAAPEAAGQVDRKKFRQVVVNLLSNAVKFTPDGGQIVITAAVDRAGRLRLAVRDTGIGIKAEDLPKLFTQFQQLDSGQTRRYQGTGLGLALTKKLVELQGGTISAESTPGQGTTFVVTLPFSHPPAPP